MIFKVKPAIVGHRGFGAGQAGGYRENSRESFVAAAGSGVPWVELDARRSSDGELVLWHDPVTPAGDSVVSRTADELAAAGITRLDDILAALPPGIGVDIDVKTVLEDAAGGAEERTHVLIARALRRYRGTRPFLISSFDPSVPAYLKDQVAPLGDDVALGLIGEVRSAAGPAISAAANLGLGAVCLHSGSLRAEPASIVEAAHGAGLEVMTWSATPAEALVLAQAGVDAVCVDDIPGAQAALAGLR